jgi:uncharacterized protein
LEVTEPFLIFKQVPEHMPIPRKSMYVLVIFLFLISLAILSLKNTLQIKITEIDIYVETQQEERSLSGISLALVSDLHLRNSSSGIENWQQLIDSINNSAADYVLLAGDYISNINDLSLVRELQNKFIDSLTAIEKPYALVLGNYETWTDRQSWLDAFAAQGIPALENQAIVLEGDKPICVIGIGDAYTGYDKSISIPPDCSQYPVIQLTHDPAAAFRADGSGIWLAGHTHCGQVRLPLLGPLWVPSEAPKESHCGLYEDEVKKVFVSSGVGSSILPLRFLAQSQIEIITFY